MTEADVRDSDAEPSNEIPEKLQEIKDDRSKALRAEKDVGERAIPEAEHLDEDPRTAVRFQEVETGTPVFDVVTTKVSGFPLGKDSYSKQAQHTVAKWVEANDPEVIDASEEGWS